MKLHIHIHTRTYIHIYIYVHVCMYVCMYTYMYHMCTYIHTCIHMYSYHVYMCVVMYKHCKSCPCQSGSTRVQLRLQKNTHVTLLKKITRNKSQSHQITDHRGTNLFFIIFSNMHTPAAPASTHRTTFHTIVALSSPPTLTTRLSSKLNFKFDT